MNHFKSIFLFALIFSTYCRGENSSTRGGGDHVKLIIENSMDELPMIFKMVTAIEAQNYSLFPYLSDGKKELAKRAQKFYAQNLEKFKKAKLDWAYPTPWPYDKELSAYTDPDDSGKKVNFNLEKLSQNLKLFDETIALELWLHELGHKIGFRGDEFFEGVLINDLLDQMAHMIVDAYENLKMSSHPDDNYPATDVYWGLVHFYASKDGNFPFLKFGKEMSCLQAGKKTKIVPVANLLTPQKGRIVNRLNCEDGKTYLAVALYVKEGTYLPYSNANTSLVIVPLERTGGRYL